MTNENDKSKNVPVIYTIIVLNFKAYIILLISLLTFSLKQGTIKRVIITMNTVNAIIIMNKY